MTRTLAYCVIGLALLNFAQLGLLLLAWRGRDRAGRRLAAQIKHHESEQQVHCLALTQQRKANERLAGDNLRLMREYRELRTELDGATKALNALVGEADLSPMDRVIG